MRAWPCFLAACLYVSHYCLYCGVIWANKDACLLAKHNALADIARLKLTVDRRISMCHRMYSGSPKKSDRHEQHDITSPQTPVNSQSSSVVRYPQYLDTYRRYLRDDTSIAKVTMYRGISQQYKIPLQTAQVCSSYHLATCKLQACDAETNSEVAENHNYHSTTMSVQAAVNKYSPIITVQQ